MNPMDYSLCDRAVTLYRRTGEGILRQVLPRCYFQCQLGKRADKTGAWVRQEFLLIVPGETVLLPGDRVVPGIGPEDVVWEQLHPDRLTGAVQIARVAPYFYNGVRCHTEARGVEA